MQEVNYKNLCNGIQDQANRELCESSPNLKNGAFFINLYLQDLVDELSFMYRSNIELDDYHFKEKKNELISMCNKISVLIEETYNHEVKNSFIIF